MANRDRTGFRPLRRLSGGPVPVKRYIVDSSSSTALAIGDVLDTNAAGSVRPAAADAGLSAIGVCVAVYDSKGVPCGAPNSSVSTKYLTASVAGYADVALGLPDCIFVAQTVTGQVPTVACINATTDHTAGTYNAYTAQSGHELTFSDLATGLQFRIMGIHDVADNSWGEHVDLEVVFNESIWLAGNASV